MIKTYVYCIVDKCLYRVLGAWWGSVRIHTKLLWMRAWYMQEGGEGWVWQKGKMRTKKVKNKTELKITSIYNTSCIMYSYKIIPMYKKFFFSIEDQSLLPTCGSPKKNSNWRQNMALSPPGDNSTPWSQPQPCFYLISFFSFLVPA